MSTGARRLRDLRVRAVGRSVRQAEARHLALGRRQAQLPDGVQCEAVEAGPGPDRGAAEECSRVGELDVGPVAANLAGQGLGRRDLQRRRSRCHGVVGDDPGQLGHPVLRDADEHRLERLARYPDVVVVGPDLDPVDRRSLDHVLAQDLGLARLERVAVAGAQARVERARVLGDLVASQGDVELDDALEALRLAQAGLRIEPDLLLRGDLGPLAGLEVDEGVLEVALVDEVEHRAVAGRRQRAVDHGRAGPGRPERDEGGRCRHDRNGGRQAQRQPARPPVEPGVAQDAVPVARAVVGRGDPVEHLGNVGHALTSSSFVCRFARAACRVADTVPRAIPRASAIPA